MDIDRLRSRISTEVIGHEILFFGTLRSTNETAHRMIDHGERKEGALILAETQTRGRGLLDRRWHSPKGLGLWMSIILYPDLPPENLPQLCLLFALSTARGISKVTGLETAVKWSNDLMIDGFKVGGILVESHSRGEDARQAVVGIGLNVNQPTEYFEEHKLPEATSLRLRLEKEVDREKLLGSCIELWEEDYRSFKEGGFELFQEEWRKRDFLADKDLVVIDDQGQRNGKSAGLDEKGRLLLDITDGQRIIAVPGKTVVRVR